MTASRPVPTYRVEAGLSKHGRSRSGGVTLVELLVLLTIVAIVQTLAAPAMSGFVDSMRLTAGINTLFSSVHIARSEAVKRSARVVLCKSTTGNSCTSTGGWEQGWIVFHDTNNNASLDAGEIRLLWEQALPHRLRLAGNSQVASYVSYTSVGTTGLTSGAFQAGTFTLCLQSSTPVEARQIVISSSGRSRTTKAIVSQCP